MTTLKFVDVTVPYADMLLTVSDKQGLDLIKAISWYVMGQTNMPGRISVFELGLDVSIGLLVRDFLAVLRKQREDTGVKKYPKNFYVRIGVKGDVHILQPQTKELFMSRL